MTDISNICNLITFIHLFGISTAKTMTSFVNTTDILEHSESMSADSGSTFWCLKQVIEDMDLHLKYLVAFCSHGHGLF